MRSLLLIFMLAATPAFAWEEQIQRTTSYDLPAGSTNNGQLVLLAERASFSGTTEDDVFVMASVAANFTGEAKADTWVMAGQTTLGGHLRDHVRAGGQSIVVSGVLDRSVLALGSTVHLTTGSVVRGGATLVGESVVIEGAIGGPVYVVAQTVTLSGALDGALRLYAQDIVIMPGTVIAGDLLYTSPKELFLDSRVHMGGELKRVEVSGRAPAATTLTAEALVLKFLQLAAALLVGLPFALLFPNLIGRATHLVRFNLLRSMLIGFAVFFLLPFLAVAMALTLVGLPLSLLAGGLAVALLYLGKVVVALVLGGLLLRRRGAQSIAVVSGAMALGLILMYIVFSLPVLGGSLALLIAITGSGALWWAMLRGEVRQQVAPPPVPAESDPIA